MNLQYQVDLMATIIRERHAALLCEAETERLFAKQQQPGQPFSGGLHKALAEFGCHFSALRAHLMQA